MALGAVTLAALGISLLPFIDRGVERNPLLRPIYTTIGVIIIAELLVLTVWGYLTPGQIIPDSQAILVNGGVAVGIAAVSLFMFRLSRRKSGREEISQRKSHLRAIALPFTNRSVTAVFLIPLVAGSVSFANVVSLLTSGQINILVVLANFSVLVVSFYAMARMMRNLSLAQNRLLS